MKYIYLSGKYRGKIIIDDHDYDILIPWKWYKTSAGYAWREKSWKKPIFMHRLVMGDYPVGKTEIDHINGNKLDNRRENLRFCTSQENRNNRMKYKTNKSGYCGVGFDKNSGKWRARIYRNKKPYYFGLFKSAKKAYEEIKRQKVKKGI